MLHNLLIQRFLNYFRHIHFIFPVYNIIKWILICYIIKQQCSMRLSIMSCSYRFIFFCTCCIPNNCLNYFINIIQQNWLGRILYSNSWLSLFFQNIFSQSSNQNLQVPNQETCFPNTRIPDHNNFLKHRYTFIKLVISLTIFTHWLFIKYTLIIHTNYLTQTNGSIKCFRQFIFCTSWYFKFLVSFFVSTMRHRQLIFLWLLK